jgi:hypothetical protein
MSDKSKGPNKKTVEKKLNGRPKKEDFVITPGGPRPRDQVHSVRPGEAVRRKEDGTYTVVPEDLPIVDERSSKMSDQYVLTPGGFRLKSLVH